MRIKAYLFQNFAQVFFPIFLVLFFVASVVILIRIAGVTAVVKITFFELLLLYLYTLPTMLFFVIPLSFFVACVISLSRLSFDYELSVLFALGMPPVKIVKIFLPIALLVSFTLLLISLVLTPLSDVAYRHFLETRKNSININLQAGEFGQRLGNWLVYAQENNQKPNSYKNLVLLTFAKEGGLIVAKEASLRNNEGIMEALLEEGKIYRENKDYLERVDFEALILRNDIGGLEDSKMGVLAYWEQAFFPNERQKKTQRNFALFILISLLPLIGLFYLPWLGIKNPRYQKNYVIMQAMVVVGGFYALVYLGATYFPFVALGVLPPLWFFIGYFGYKKFISRYY